MASWRLVLDAEGAHSIEAERTELGTEFADLAMTISFCLVSYSDITSFNDLSLGHFLSRTILNFENQY